jgi:hypothetical protein
MPKAKYFTYKAQITNGPHTHDDSGGKGKRAGRYPQYHKHKAEAGKVPPTNTEPNPSLKKPFVLRKLGRRMEWRKR